ncbi:MAG: DNA topoisomerase 3 [Cytophagales bacterium]|nr:DNA topoisomerase 3 [Cytophagales bacterium]
MTTLFICEKPSQAGDIAVHVGARNRGRTAHTGDGVIVTWCIGHLLEQSPPEFYVPELRNWDMNYLPVVPNDWNMQVKESTKSQFFAVKDFLRQASNVVIATDADREGEVIAREVMHLCGYRGPAQRLWLGALDAASVKKALSKLKAGSETLPLYKSGMGRARADWLAGMNITMALTKAFGSGGRGGVLHFGRVQTPVLSLIVRRERAILNFKPKAHFLLEATFEINGSIVPMSWVMTPALRDADGHCVNRAAIEAVALRVRNQAGRVTDVKTTPERELAPLLYSLGAIQKEASSKFGYKAKQVLDACQKLYETHKATTYPRTDCEYLPESMFADATAVLQALTQVDASLNKQVAMAKLDKAGRAFNDKKITAHHAIIPTSNAGVSMRDMSPVERNVYDLIRRRYLAQFLGDFEYLKTVVQVTCVGELFNQTGKLPLKQGWRQAYAGMEAATSAASAAGNTKGAVADEKPVEVVLPSVATGDQAINRKAELKIAKTEPPKRYTEGTLLGAMESIDKEIDDPRMKKIMQAKEKAGIGTEATRASIIEGLFKREYIVNDKKAIYPLPRGVSLIELLERISPELADPVLTALWEEQLMQIEAGTNTLEQFESGMASWLKPLIDKIKSQAGQFRIEATTHGVPAQVKTSQAKPSVPRSFKEAQRPALTSILPASATGGASGQVTGIMVCAACGKPMKLRTGPRGQFHGCTGFPNCRSTQPA